MPFGLNTAPFYFTRLMKPVLAFLREKFKITIFSYIDDIIVLEECFEKAKINLDITLNFLRFLGFKLNPKSNLTPITEFKFIGVDFNLEKDEMQNCSKYINNAVLLIDKILSENKVTRRELEKLAGSLNFMCKYMNISRINIHPLLSKIKSISSSSRDLQVPLDQHLQTTLIYWKDLKSYEQILILSQNPLYSIYVDASNQGWGATVHKDQMTQSWSGKWDAQVKSQHINLKELNGVLQIFKILPLEIQSCHIII